MPDADDRRRFGGLRCRPAPSSGSPQNQSPAPPCRPRACSPWLLFACGLAACQRPASPHVLGKGCRADGAQRRAAQAAVRRVPGPEVQRRALQVHPYFVGQHAVPARVLHGFEQKVDRGQCAAHGPAVLRHDLDRGAEHLTVPAAFGVRLELQLFNQLPGARRGEGWGVAGLGHEAQCASNPQGLSIAGDCPLTPAGQALCPRPIPGLRWPGCGTSAHRKTAPCAPPS
jgi:hypothetical protein